MHARSASRLVFVITAIGWLGSVGCSSELASLTARVCRSDADCPSARCADGFCTLTSDNSDASTPDSGDGGGSDTSPPLDATTDDTRVPPDDPCALDRECARGERCDVRAGECVDIAPSGGIFSDSGQELGSAQSQDVALGDIDGDGDLDAVIANDFQSGKVYLNDGDGVFSDSGQLLGDNQTRSHAVQLGDLDGDGDLDAFFTGLQQPNRVYINREGLLTDSGQALGESNTRGVALGDIDGDGDLDAVVANFDQPDVVWLNDGQGGFTDSGQALSAFFTEDVALADLDGDGDLDAVLANNMGQSNRVLINDGEGGFTDSGRAVGNGGSYCIAIGDVDGDGDLDILIGNAVSAGGGQPDPLFLNDGDALFSDSGQALGAPNAFTQDIAFADVDGDGDLDIVIADEGDPDRVFLNDGRGDFTDSGQVLASERLNVTNSIALGDLDGDGDLDLFTANIDEPNRVWFNE